MTKYDESRCLHIVRFDDGDTKEYVGAGQLCDPLPQHVRIIRPSYVCVSRFELIGKRIRLVPDTPGAPAST